MSELTAAVAAAEARALSTGAELDASVRALGEVRAEQEASAKDLQELEAGAHSRSHFSST